MTWGSIRCENFRIDCMPKCGICYMKIFTEKNIEKLRDIKVNIFIYRDPAERLISFYTNKIMLLENTTRFSKSKLEEINISHLNLWKEQFGLTTLNISFRDFVKLLKKNLKPDTHSDKHLTSQHTNYNKEIKYDLICNIKDNKKFQNYLNKFNDNLDYNINDVDSNKTITIEKEMLVCDFKKEDFEKFGGFPKNKMNFLDQEIVEDIKKLYEEDYKFIQSLN